MKMTDLTEVIGSGFRKARYTTFITEIIPEKAEKQIKEDETIFAEAVFRKDV